jgi:hypothetical protein
MRSIVSCVRDAPAFPSARPPYTLAAYGGTCAGCVKEKENRIPEAEPRSPAGSYFYFLFFFMNTIKTPDSTQPVESTHERSPMVHDGVFDPREVVAHCNEVRVRIALAQQSHVDIPV